MISSLLHLVGLRPRVYYTLTNFRGGGKAPLAPPSIRQCDYQGWGQVQYLYLSTYLSVLAVLEYLSTWYLSTWCMEMSKYLYLYLTKEYLVLTSNFQVGLLCIKKCKNSLHYYNCFHTWYQLQIALYAL